MAKKSYYEKKAEKRSKELSDAIKEEAKKVPLEIRLFSYFEDEWYNINIRDVGERRNWTRREERMACTYAKNKAKDMAKILKKWIRDGMPLMPRNADDLQKMELLGVLAF